MICKNHGALLHEYFPKISVMVACLPQARLSESRILPGAHAGSINRL
jgi:hypothetical protein